MGTIYTVRMPDIGEGVVEGEVIRWLKQVGEPLAQDEPVVILMTDKATVELPAPHPGTLAKQYYPPGHIAIKDQPLYDIALQEEASPPIAEQTQPAPSKQTAPSIETPKAAASPSRPKTTTSALATPAVRHLARTLAVDINTIQGTGPEGRVVKEDLKRTSTALSIPQLAGDEVRPLTGIRRLTARHVSASKASIPHFTYCDTADVTSLVQFREKLKVEAARRGIQHLTYTPLFLRALSLALKRFPDCNASFDAPADALVVHTQHNMGIAMKTPLGLIVPVLRGVEKMSFEELSRAYEQLRERAVAGSLDPSDMRDGTITLSNFGTEGGRFATPVIHAPEVAILATGRIRKEVLVKGEQLVIRDTLNCSWSFDHRVVDGDLAAAVSNQFIHLLEHPLELL